MQNEIWADLIIDALIGQGINYFCCTPGSRSSPLLLAIARHPKAKKIVHFDERGAAFHAVGYAKASRRPAVVIPTSGTAVGNLLPATMEAYNDRVPLILLTADRPPELRDCGANQTCDQTKLFTNHICWQVELPCPGEGISEQYLASTINQAALMARQGPVHINCLLREPLLLKSKEERSVLNRHLVFQQPLLVPSQEVVDYWAGILSSHPKGVILAASNVPVPAATLFALAEKLQWPIIADILSGLKCKGGHSCLIAQADLIFKCGRELECSKVVQFGDRIVSKAISEWLNAQKPEVYLHVSEHTMRQDPLHLVTHRIHVDPCIFVERLLSKNFQGKGGLFPWVEWQKECARRLEHFFENNRALTEPSVIHYIASCLKKEWNLFVGTSMPIRDAQNFLPEEFECHAIFGNRGVSGIDGLVATSAGIAAGSEKPTLAIIGDLALLHDLNSLYYLHQLKQPLIICVVNNGGGGIFSFLPVAERKEAFEELIATSHTLSFAAAAKLFNLPYFHPQTGEELTEILGHSQTCLIEITTERAKNVQDHAEIIHAIRKPKLVFLHGFLGCKEDWNEILPHFEQDFECIAINLPGHGGADESEDILENVKQILLKHGPAKPILIGYSMGGRIALQLQEYASALIIISGHIGLHDEEKSERLKSDLEWSEKLLTLPFDLFLQEWYSQKIFYNLKPQILQRRSRNQNPAALARVLMQLSLSKQPRIQSFDCPTLFVHGSEDSKYKEIYSKLSDKVRVSEIQESGHAPFLDNPISCTETLLRFLHEHSR